MIFLTIGSHEPFDRLARALDAWCAARPDAMTVFGQITDHAEYEPTSFEWVGNLAPDVYLERCKAATLLVSHAGMGSIITAGQFGKPIVVMPRRAAMRETRNDHQVATAKRFESRPGVHVAIDEHALPATLDSAIAGLGAAGEAIMGPFAQPQLIDAIRAVIHE